MITQFGDMDRWWLQVQGLLRDYGPVYLRFGLLLGAAVVLGWIPYLRRPLQWAETFYHETSHGLVCVLTRGRVVGLVLHPDGSGACIYGGGWKIPVALAGYLGAALWGGLIYLIGAEASGDTARLWLVAEIVLLGLSWLWLVVWPLLRGKYASTADAVRTSLVLFTLTGLYTLALLYSDVGVLPLLLQFLGLYVLLNALRAPLILLGHSGKNDAMDLRRSTGIPATVWTLLWFGFGLWVLLWVMGRTLPGLQPVLAEMARWGLRLVGLA